MDDFGFDKNNAMSVDSVLQPTGDIINTPILKQRLGSEQLFVLSFGNAKVDRLFKEIIMNQKPGGEFMDMKHLSAYEKVLATVFNHYHHEMETSAISTEDFTNMIMKHSDNSTPDKFMALAMNPMMTDQEFHRATIEEVFGKTFINI